MGPQQPAIIWTAQRHAPAKDHTLIKAQQMVPFFKNLHLHEIAVSTAQGLHEHSF